MPLLNILACISGSSCQHCVIAPPLRLHGTIPCCSRTPFKICCSNSSNTLPSNHLLAFSLSFSHLVSADIKEGSSAVTPLSASSASSASESALARPSMPNAPSTPPSSAAGECKNWGISHFSIRVRMSECNNKNISDSKVPDWPISTQGPT